MNGIFLHPLSNFYYPFFKLYSIIYTAHVHLKRLVFETTFLRETDIVYSCNYNSAFCLGCNTQIFVITQLNNADSFDNCAEKVCHPLCASGCTGQSNTQCPACTSDINIVKDGASTCRCKDGTYYKDYSLLCLPCHPLCSKCISNLNTTCTQCKANVGISLMNNYKCDCINGYFYKNAIELCQICHPLCLKCFGESNSSCLECKAEIGISSLFGNTCSCMSGYFFMDSTFLCQPCHSLCKECVWEGNSACTICQSDARIKEINNGVCECIDGYYYMDSKNLCQACHPLCSLCSNPSSSLCIECKSGVGISIASDGICKCLDGYYYLNSTLLCQSCHNLCRKCYSAANSTCIECINEEGVSGITNSICDCISGYYYDRKVFACIKCAPFCRKCLSYEICTECKGIEYIVLNGKCMINCTYSERQILSYCISCRNIENCIRCRNNICLQCKSSFILFDNTCNSDCPIGYYIYRAISLALSCRPCYKSCYNCTSEKRYGCITCKEGYRKETKNSYCIQIKCMQNEYIDGYKCALCHERCISCKGPGIESCLACKQTYIGYKIESSFNVLCKECSEINTGLIYKEEIQSCEGKVINRNMWGWEKYWCQRM